MSDIIKDAKQLLEGATPGPWEWFGYDLEQTFDAGGAIVMEATCENPHLGGVVNVEITPEDERLIAAAPELAQALAEETYEYSVQIKDHTGERETATNSESHLEEWWESKKHAEWAMAEEQEFGERCRIVRRRVSPPEVINE